MEWGKIANIFFLALGIASCVYLIISILYRNFKRELKNMKNDIINELKNPAPHA